MYFQRSGQLNVSIDQTINYIMFLQAKSFVENEEEEDSSPWTLP